MAMDLGTVVEMQPRSSRERLRRKKYVGVWRCWWQAVLVMMRPLPRSAAREMPRKSQKCQSCSSRVAANGRRRKWVVELPLDICCLWPWGTVIGEKGSDRLGETGGMSDTEVQFTHSRLGTLWGCRGKAQRDLVMIVSEVGCFVCFPSVTYEK